MSNRFNLMKRKFILKEYIFYFFSLLINQYQSMLNFINKIYLIIIHWNKNSMQNYYIIYLNECLFLFFKIYLFTILLLLFLIITFFLFFFY
jgi:hypothetical protein